MAEESTNMPSVTSSVDVAELFDQLMTLESETDDQCADLRYSGTIFIQGLKSKQAESSLRTALGKITKEESFGGYNEISFSKDKSAAFVALNHSNEVDGYIRALKKETALFHDNKGTCVEKYDSHVHKTSESKPSSERRPSNSLQSSPDPCPKESGEDVLGDFRPHPEHRVTYDAIVIENLHQIFRSPIDLDTLRDFLSKFALFGELSAVYIPLHERNSDGLVAQGNGYIAFAHHQGVSKNVLECLYHLGSMTLAEIRGFSKIDITDLSQRTGFLECSVEEDEEPRLTLSLCQKKHSHSLLDNSSSLFVALTGDSSREIQVCEVEKHKDLLEKSLLPRFTRDSNYQETNVYVNNLPLLFENDDAKWQSFWSQFGPDGINSAKIIKPQFYSKTSDPSFGKFGFVFYKDVRMAIRAIIATDNKALKYKEHHEIYIQSSFAIQKKNSTSSRRQGSRVIPYNLGSEVPYRGELPKGYHMLAKRFSSPAIFDTRVSPPMLSAPTMPGPGISAPLLPFHESFFMNPVYYPMPPPLARFDSSSSELADINGPSDLSLPRRSSDGPQQNHPMMNPGMYSPFGYYYYPYPGCYNLHDVQEHPAQQGLSDTSDSK